MKHEEALDTAMTQLTEQDFYSPIHQKVFKAIYKLHADSKTVDITTTSNQLQRDNHLQKIGGLHLEGPLSPVPLRCLLHETLDRIPSHLNTSTLR